MRDVHVCICREVPAAGELMVEVWDLGGTRGAKQMKKLADNPSQVIRNSRFLGQAEIPLVDTLTDTQRGDHSRRTTFGCVYSGVALWSMPIASACWRCLVTLFSCSCITRSRFLSKHSCLEWKCRIVISHQANTWA